MDALESQQLYISLNQILDKADGDGELIEKLQRMTQTIQYLQSPLIDHNADILECSLRLRLKDELLKICKLLKQKYCISLNESVVVWLLSIE